MEKGNMKEDKRNMGKSSISLIIFMMIKKLYEGIEPRCGGYSLIFVDGVPKISSTFASIS
jgi:hypothetical protein